MLLNWEAPPEKYSSFKKRMFHQYKEKARKIFNGIDYTSLQKGDKIKLKNQIIEQVFKL